MEQIKRVFLLLLIILFSSYVFGLIVAIMISSIVDNSFKITFLVSFTVNISTWIIAVPFSWVEENKLWEWITCEDE